MDTSSYPVGVRVRQMSCRCTQCGGSIADICRKDLIGRVFVVAMITGDIRYPVADVRSREDYGAFVSELELADPERNDLNVSALESMKPDPFFSRKP